jgi:hypothetical protein
MAENKPHWWSALHDVSWDQIKKTAIDDWHKVAGQAQKLERAAAERAIAFGHGARDVYGKVGTWTTDVEAKLKADWEATHKDAAVSWEKVKDAVKHGWERMPPSNKS